MKHLDSLLQLDQNSLKQILTIAKQLKRKFVEGSRPALLQGHVLALLFEKPSLRTRISFEVAAAQLGGTSIFLSGADAGLNGRESLADVARVLSGYCDAIVIRTFSQGVIDEAARIANCPIINGLSDLEHPCQALSDLMTIEESLGSLQGKRIVFVGDGNNVARSLLVAASLSGMKFELSSPPGFEFEEDFLGTVKQRIPSLDYALERDPHKAVAKADIIYTDVWTSMGQEAESERRKQIFGPYQVNAKLMEAAPPHAKFMHCLPAKRGVEVTDEVIDGPRSIVFPQADNRMHLAKGLLVWLLGREAF